MDVEIEWREDIDKYGALDSTNGFYGGYKCKIKDYSTEINSWYCCVMFADECIFDSNDAGIQPTDDDSGKELCRMIIEMDLGIMDPATYFKRWKELSQ